MMERPDGSQLTPELAGLDPETFKEGVLNTLAANSAYGALLWNHCVNKGVVKPEEFTIRPGT